MYTAIISPSARIPSILTYQRNTLRYFGSTGKHASVSGDDREGSFKIGSTIKPIKMAYSSYESTNPTVSSSDWPVIIMHGLMGSKSNWNSLSKVIHSKTKRKIFAVDARNHGESPHTAELSYHHLAEDVRALMQDLGIKQGLMIGHSMGGRAMMLLALKYPELVEKLIVVDISPIGSSPNLSTLPKYIDGMRMVKLDSSVPLSKARKIADEQMAILIPDAGIRQFFLTNLVEVSPGHYKWRVNLEAIARNISQLCSFPPTASSFDKPTYFIGGADSDYIRSN
ncbi:sn-1-specific diacylglycerol lipase ABHD11 isoform X2 [Anabrus simplex]|uniref:sn-1-specific diacylglycerol lipase ABHD11 isoform X2 n=1 Tax=Anabrus simplex TaxID=316456 RepID=UPI0034DCF88C